VIFYHIKTGHEPGRLLERQEEIKARFSALQAEYLDWQARVKRLRDSSSASQSDKAALLAEKNRKDEEVRRLEDEARSNQADIKRIIESGGLNESARLHEKKSAQHRGGFSASEHGWVEGKPVTFALGWGTKNGHTLIADGHVDERAFRQSSNHDHYGPGDGPNNNGTLRRRYTGPGN
jgi:hypothetical protein